jgi:hypothetical protein
MEGTGKGREIARKKFEWGARSGLKNTSGKSVREIG